MTQEEKFKEAKRLYETANADQRYVLESLFPELKEESEDERIRKELIRIVDIWTNSAPIVNGIPREKLLAYLKKQGKENPLKGTLGDVFDDLKFGLDPSPKQSEQKPIEWSEKDERMLSCAEEAVKAYFSEIGNEGSVIYWLKSLKDRYTWKPSLSQLNALGVVAKGNAPDDIEEINSLYNDLKKL